VEENFCKTLYVVGTGVKCIPLLFYYNFSCFFILWKYWEKEIKNVISDNYINIIDILADKLDLDKSVYRSCIQSKEKFSWHVIYKYTDLFISSDKDIKSRIEKPVKKIYKELGFVIKKDQSFLKSLSPVIIKPFFPPIIKKMCALSKPFNVGPMAAVAGTVNDYISTHLIRYCRSLLIENGGDLFLSSMRDLKVGVYLKNSYFKNKLVLKIKAKDMPCGLCASSSTFGHSLSLGKCDLAVVQSDSPIAADAAATAVANSIITADDIEKSIDYFTKIGNLTGLLIVKDNRMGIWGNIELCKN
jgi:ApbE superfamily uncharacterized protein (UPF0280 family)